MVIGNILVLSSLVLLHHESDHDIETFPVNSHSPFNTSLLFFPRLRLPYLPVAWTIESFQCSDRRFATPTLRRTLVQFPIIDTCPTPPLPSESAAIDFCAPGSST